MVKLLYIQYIFLNLHLHFHQSVSNHSSPEAPQKCSETLFVSALYQHSNLLCCRWVATALILIILCRAVPEFRNSCSIIICLRGTLQILHIKVCYQVLGRTTEKSCKKHRMGPEGAGYIEATTVWKWKHLEVQEEAFKRSELTRPL